MTSTAVKMIGSLANYASAKAASNRQDELTDNFTDVFSKASGQQHMASQADSIAPGSSKLKVDHLDKKGLDSRQSPKAENGSSIQEEGLDETAKKNMEEAGEKLVGAVAKELGVSEEEVVEAMEALGLSATDLLNADNMTQLVLALKGVDALSLMTDEGLYHSLQNLLGVAADVQQELAAQLGVKPEELAALLEQVKAAEAVAAEPQGQIVPSEEGMVAEGQEDYAVTVERDGEMVKVSVEVDGNAKTESSEVISGKLNVQKEEMSQTGKDNSKGETASQGDNTQANLLLENLFNREASVKADAAFDTAMAGRAANTQDIMNQIMEYMRVHIKADLTQMEIQLHPASLGTVNVNITAKEGVITAQFLTQNEMVKAAIESQLVQLRTSFEEQGIKVDAVEVVVESHQFERNLSGEGNGQQQLNGEKKRGVRKLNLNELSLEDEAELSEEEQIAVSMMSVEGNTVDYTA